MAESTNQPSTFYRLLQDIIDNEKTSLSLGFNQIRHEGAFAIAEALKVNPVLSTLLLNRNRIGLRGAQFLAQGLKKNKTLRTLDVSYNSIGDEGARALLQAESAVVTFNFAGDKLSEKAGSMIVSCINNINTVNKLELSNNAILKEDLEEIKKQLSGRTRVKKSKYEEALASTTRVSWMRSKLMLIGQGKAGKTATVGSLLDEPFESDWFSTVGLTSSETKFTQNIWQRAAADNFTARIASVIAVEEMRQETKKEQENEMRKTIRRVLKDDPNYKLKFRQSNPIYGLESKEEREKENEVFTVPNQEKQIGNETIRNLGTDVFLQMENDVDAIRVSIWDLGGQEVFHSLHNIYLTRFSVYLLVFDMYTLLTQTIESQEHILFWINSIKLHAPDAPVLLVGTFLDKEDQYRNRLLMKKGYEEDDNISMYNSDVEAESEEEEAEIKLKKVPDSLITKVQKPNFMVGEANAIVKPLVVDAAQIKQNTINKWSFWPISNKTRAGVQGLRQAVQETIRKQEYLHQLVSVSWMKCLDLLIKSSSFGWINSSSLQTSAKAFDIDSRGELNQMLELFHELGMVLYFSKSDPLRNIIITNPQWLIDEFCKVIRDKDVHPMNNLEIRRIGLEQDSNLLLQNGLASRDLLDYLWPRDKVDYLIELLQQLILLKRWPYNSGSSEEIYIVPSMLNEDNGIKSPYQSFYRFKFEFLPVGVFERIICLIADYSHKSGLNSIPRLSKNRCTTKISDDLELYIERSWPNIIKVSGTRSTRAKTIVPFIENLLKKLEKAVFSNGLAWNIDAEVDGKFMPVKRAVALGLLPWLQGVEEENGSVEVGHFLEGRVV